MIMANQEEMVMTLRRLRELLQAETHEHCVSVTFTFTSQGYTVETSMRSPGGLKRDGVSMRNLRGEWVK
jgi:hypothetical protein